MPHFTHLFKGDILYPKQHALAGDCWGHDDEDNPHRWVTFCPQFPHLFRPLKWWEGLAIDELPKYVKFDGKVSKIIKLIWGDEDKGEPYCTKVEYNGDGLFHLDNQYQLKGFWWNEVDPATEAEYQEYLTKLNGK
jgi:hypothetical protein